MSEGEPAPEQDPQSVPPEANTPDSKKSKHIQAAKRSLNRARLARKVAKRLHTIPPIPAPVDPDRESDAGSP